MRVFKDIQLVEHIGSGIPRILKKYDCSIFKFTPNFLRVTFNYPEIVIDEGYIEETPIDSIEAPIRFEKAPIESVKAPIGFKLGKHQQKNIEVL